MDSGTTRSCGWMAAGDFAAGAWALEGRSEAAASESNKESDRAARARERRQAFWFKGMVLTGEPQAGRKARKFVEGASAGRLNGRRMVRLSDGCEWNLTGTILMWRLIAGGATMRREMNGSGVYFAR